MRRRKVSSKGWGILRAWLPRDLDGPAQQCGLWQRARGLQDAECWLRLMLMHVAGGLSLEQTVVRARELGWADLSAVALFKRLARAQRWLEYLTGYVLAQQRRRLGECERPFPYRLRVIDTTDIQEPGSTGSGWRLHYSIRLPELVCDHCEISDEHGAESLGRFKFERNELILVDRGYSYCAQAAQVLDSGALLLLRWKPNALPLEAVGGKPIHLLERLRRLPGHSAGEWKVQFVYRRKVYYLRLCAVRKSRQAAERARRKVLLKARNEGHKASAQSLELAQYILVLTNLPPSFSCCRVLQLYRCRWQIELVFKRLKSLLEGGHVPKSNDASILAWMQAKILCALLLERVLLEGRFFFLAGQTFRRGQPLEGGPGGAGFLARGTGAGFAFKAPDAPRSRHRLVPAHRASQTPNATRKGSSDLCRFTPC
jgi:DDE family transposase